MIIRFDGNKAARKLLDFLYDCAGNLLTGRFAISPSDTKPDLILEESWTMSATGRIKEKLIIALRPTRLDVTNESELHAGHRSSPGTGESHFRVLVVSDAFTGKSRVERHRVVNELLKDELAGGIHALALMTLAPGEPLPEAGPDGG